MPSDNIVFLDRSVLFWQKQNSVKTVSKLFRNCFDNRGVRGHPLRRKMRNGKPRIDKKMNLWGQNALTLTHKHLEVPNFPGRDTPVTR